MFQVRNVRVAGSLLAAVLFSGPAGAAVAPDRTSPLAQKEFRHAAFHIPNRVQRVDEQPVAARQGLTDSLADLHASAQTSYVDVRSGRWATLYPVQPLLPGSGDGNSISWEALGLEAPADAKGWERASWEAFARYVESQSRALGVDVREMQPGRVTVHDDGGIVQIVTPRVFEGVPVRDSYLTAIVNHGNLVLFGANQWGTIRTASRPTVGAERARTALAGHMQTLAPSGYRRQPSLAYVVLSAGALESLAAASDSGYDYRLVWVLSPKFEGDLGTWEALVDAHSGELLALQDTNQYQSVRRVQGGVLAGLQRRRASGRRRAAGLAVPVRGRRDARRELPDRHRRQPAGLRGRLDHDAR